MSGRADANVRCGGRLCPLSSSRYVAFEVIFVARCPASVLCSEPTALVQTLQQPANLTLAVSEVRGEPLLRRESTVSAPVGIAGWGKPYDVHELRLLDLLAGESAPPASAGKGKRVGRTVCWQRLSKAWGRRYKEQVKPNALRMRWERFAVKHPEDVLLLTGAAATKGDGVKVSRGRRVQVWHPGDPQALAGITRGRRAPTGG